MSEDPKVSARYRELPPEEPSRALDDAILAASRRAVDARPAPLVVPSGRRRWTFPLAAAAVIVLAVAVTVHVERERPDAEAMSGPAAMQEAKRKDQAAPAQEAPRPIAKKAPAPAQPVFTPDPQPQSKAEPAPERRNEMQQHAERDFAAAPAAAAPAPAAPAEPEARQERARVQGARSADEVRAAAPLAKLSAQSPEQLLQGIADLRRQGRHEEADKALAEFRKRYPDYRLSEEVRAKVERQ